MTKQNLFDSDISSFKQLFARFIISLLFVEEEEEGCVFCTSMIPRCRPKCNPDEECKIVSQTCFLCPYAYCEKKDRSDGKENTSV
ncbi:hypothetical protein G9A89_010695 [Geosiphon pyriformis]|nr:hypothetical protein G9A89_010695 [Geosiphon pyriformis]